jgi:hypothetical protein
MVNEETSRTAEAGNGSVGPIMTTSNESAPTTPPAPKPLGNIGFWAQIRPHLELVTKLVPTVWSVFLFAGGLVFLTYFWSIGFMPELDVKASVTLLAVSAITGSTLFLWLAIGLLTPSLIWVHMIRTCDPLKGLWSADNGEVLPRHVLPWLDWPICGVITGLLGGILLKFYGVGGWWSVWAGFLGGLLISGGIVGYRLRRKLGNRFDQKQRRDAILQFYASFVINSILFLVVTLGIVAPFADSSYFVKPDVLGLKPDTAALVLLTVAIFVIVRVDSEIAINLSGIKDDRPNSRFFIASVIIYLIVLLCLPITIANSVMHIYKFGRLNNASLILDETGCNIIEH